MNDLLDLDLRPWKSFDNVSNVTDQQLGHISDNLEVIKKKDSPLLKQSYNHDSYRLNQY